MGCVLLWCDVVLCYAVLYGRRNLTKNPSLKLSGKHLQNHMSLGIGLVFVLRDATALAAIDW